MSTEETVRREEELRIGAEAHGVGMVRAQKRVESELVGREFPRRVERSEIERLPAEKGDSGQIETLPDGSVSIPVLEEELVVTKRTVVRERIVIRKATVVESQRVEAELRREVVDVEVEEQEEGPAGR